MAMTSFWRLGACALALTGVLTGLGGCGGSSGGGFSFLPPPAQEPPPSDGPARKWGYITLPDGNKMRYAVWLPKATGSFPLLLEYDGYTAGSDPSVISRRWLSEGYAVMGLSVPGTGCSTGDDQWADHSVGVAGAFAVEWAARQSWSNGKVGMIGFSYSGYNQLWVAAQRPPSLVAITPGKNVGDPYRDVGWPGGIANIGFPAAWWGRFPDYWKDAAAMAARLDGDTECARTAAENTGKIKRPDLDLTEWLKSPYADSPDYIRHSAVTETAKIDIPTLGTQSWQDEQVGPRMAYYEETIAPEKMWLISSNGTHDTDMLAPRTSDTLKRFLAHFLKGEDNGFDKEPRVQLLQELQKTDTPAAFGAPDYLATRPTELVPTAVAQFDRLPVKVKPMRLWLQPGGGLRDVAPTGSNLSSNYAYPAKSPEVNNPLSEGWKAVTTPTGQAVFTTAVLPEDLSFYGEGSADLWLNATASDTDLQVTLSEVRPDGQEMFVQRGWLRASQRALDTARSTVLRPWGTFSRSTEAPLVAGQPNLARVEIQKFAHVFRAGSALRVTIDTPSQTGFWVFGHRDTPSTNTLWHDAAHGSSIVLGHVPYAHAKALPSCDKTLRQPCRANQIAPPAGTGPRPPA